MDRSIPTWDASVSSRSSGAVIQRSLQEHLGWFGDVDFSPPLEDLMARRGAIRLDLIIVGTGVCSALCLPKAMALRYRHG